MWKEETSLEVWFESIPTLKVFGSRASAVIQRWTENPKNLVRLQVLPPLNITLISNYLH